MCFIFIFYSPFFCFAVHRLGLVFGQWYAILYPLTIASHPDCLVSIVDWTINILYFFVTFLFYSYYKFYRVLDDGSWIFQKFGLLKFASEYSSVPSSLWPLKISWPSKMFRTNFFFKHETITNGIFSILLWRFKMSNSFHLALHPIVETMMGRCHHYI